MAHSIHPTVDDAGGSASTVLSPLIDAGGARWFRFLSRWSLFAGLAVLGIFLAFGFGVVPAGQGSPLPQEHSELWAAINSPAAYRLFLAFDIAVWLAYGGFFVALAAVLFRHAPIRGALIAACGVGQVLGMTGAFMRLYGTTDIAARYAGAAPEQQETLLQANLDLWQIVGAHFGAGAMLTRVALLLAAWAVWSMPGFPRWLAVLIALPGIVGLMQTVLDLTAGVFIFPILLVQLLLSMVVFFAVARTFWRKPESASPGAGSDPRLAEPRQQGKA